MKLFRRTRPLPARSGEAPPGGVAPTDELPMRGRSSQPPGHSPPITGPDDAVCGCGCGATLSSFLELHGPSAGTVYYSEQVDISPAAATSPSERLPDSNQNSAEGPLEPRCSTASCTSVDNDVSTRDACTCAIATATADVGLFGLHEELLDRLPAELTQQLQLSKHVSEGSSCGAATAAAGMAAGGATAAAPEQTTFCSCGSGSAAIAGPAGAGTASCRGGGVAARGGSVAVDWERLPLHVWDSVWRNHLDDVSQMALCLAHPIFWERWHEETLAALLESDVAACPAKFAVRLVDNSFSHPTDVVYLQMVLHSQRVAWFRMVDAFLRRAAGAAEPHESILTVPTPAAALKGRCTNHEERDLRLETPGLVKGRQQDPHMRHIELRCQLPESFTPGDAGKLLNLRLGFCWGHLPAHFGGVQHCLLISGSSRGAHYWYDVKVKLRRQATSAISAVRKGTVNVSSPGSIGRNAPSGNDCHRQHSSGGSGGGDGGSSGRIFLELVAMWGIACPQIIAG